MNKKQKQAEQQNMFWKLYDDEVAAIEAKRRRNRHRLSCLCGPTPYFPCEATGNGEQIYCTEFMPSPKLMNVPSQPHKCNFDSVGHCWNSDAQDASFDRYPVETRIDEIAEKHGITRETVLKYYSINEKTLEGYHCDEENYEIEEET